MNRNEFMQWLQENFDLDGGAAFRLVYNILCYTEQFAEDEHYNILTELLDGIGLSDNEIKDIYL